MKGIVRIIMGARTRDSCRELFKILQILPLTSQYIFSLALFVVNKKSLCMENSQLHNIKTGNNSILFHLSSHLMIYQQGPHYFGINVYNKLPCQIKNLSAVKQFKRALNNFLQLHSFCTSVEYFSHSEN
jgi:hypothetical protein